MKSSFTDPEKKRQLAASFTVVEKWARAADSGKFGSSGGNFDKLADAAAALHEISDRPNPAEAMRHAARLVHAMDDMIDLQKQLRKLPGDDADRNNNELRTALRRIEKVRMDDVWHIQLT